ncbi:MAG: LuxR family transcriptional regulator [Eggerthellaceae bacterium]|nr:LuxR family transcriptional regulator [Eggerthellaceae bacterium]
MRNDDREIRKAWAAIGGFACNQGFLFAAFYLGSNEALQLGHLAFERSELFGMLLCMAGAFAALSLMSPKARNALLSPRFAWGYAALLVLCSMAPSIFGSFGLLSFVLESVFVGVPLAFLLCAWGRVLGSFPVERSVPTVFIATALASALCMAFASMPFSWAHLVLYLLPLGSASFLREAHRDLGECDVTEVSTQSSTEARALSRKVMLGTFFYGLATGAMETFASDPGMPAAPAFAVTFFLLAMFCLAALQLFKGVRIARVRDFFGNHESGPLDASYRLAFMVMIAGLLFMPALDAFEVLGESIVLAGYLGMAVVLISLFVIMGRVRALDAALSFAEGFGFLYAGELVGLMVGNLLQIEVFSWAHSSLVVGFAGLVVLYSFLFLFTDRDVNELTVAAGEGDSFERACERIASESALSKREAEVLPLALRGRTSERIAQELFISKNTVDTHMRRIYAKCGVTSRQELIDLGERVQKELR